MGSRVLGQIVLDGAEIGVSDSAGGTSDGVLEMEGLWCGNPVFLSSWGAGRIFISRRKVLLGASKIEGDLSLSGGQFHARNDGIAISARGIDVRGGIAMGRLRFDAEAAKSLERDDMPFNCSGSILLPDSRMKDLVTPGASFRHTTNADGRASVILDLEGARLNGALKMSGTEHMGLILDLRSAWIDWIEDSRGGWPARGNLILDRLAYASFSGDGTPRDLASRMEWLNLQRPDDLGMEFKPQPWEQCAKVPCDPGLRADGGTLASTTQAPRLLARGGEAQLDCFGRQAEASGYPAFNAWVYSADTLLPIVQLGMQQFWIPDSGATSPLGRLARWFLWVQIVAGWALSLLAVAGFSGLIKQDSS